MSKIKYFKNFFFPVAAGTILLSSSVSFLTSCSKQQQPKNESFKLNALDSILGIVDLPMHNIVYLTFEQIAQNILSETFNDKKADNTVYHLFASANKILYSNQKTEFSNTDNFQVLIDSAKTGELQKCSDGGNWKTFLTCSDNFKKKLSQKDETAKATAISYFYSQVNSHDDLKIAEVSIIFDDNSLYQADLYKLVSEAFPTLSLTEFVNLSLSQLYTLLTTSKNLSAKWWVSFSEFISGYFNKLDAQNKIKASAIDEIEKIKNSTAFLNNKNSTLIQIALNSSNFAQTIGEINNLSSTISNILKTSVGDINSITLTVFLSDSNIDKLKKSFATPSLWTQLKNSAKTFYDRIILL
ncbi:MAG: hypothetical protein LBB39_01020 [Mycoplasmataceae bacterium]|nr:hypothetical protein [Mycoplasmataceae bacterium]